MAALALPEAAQEQYASDQERRGTIKNRVGIDERPVIVEQKSRIGDWEGDTVIGKNHRGALVTLAERKSRYILAAKVPGKHASGVTAAVTKLLRPHKGKSYTMTFGNGKEFAEHKTIAAELDVDVYFAHPYHSWERGLNENNNELCYGSTSPRGWNYWLKLPRNKCNGRWIGSTIDHARCLDSELRLRY